MELDLKSIKALASATRIQILQKSLEKDATPTSLAEDLGRSKSTISSHLEKLTEAELLEKDSEEGRRRVVYRPTSKAEAIASGKKRKVRFSLATSGLTAFAGFAILGKLWNKTSEQAADMGMMAATETAQKAGESGLIPEEFLLIAGLGFLSIAIGSIVYSLLMRKIGS